MSEVVTMHKNDVICIACGGDCCKTCSGTYHPDDLAPLTIDSLAKRFKTGAYAIDWWEGDPRDGKDELDAAYYVRPAHKGISKLYDGSWGGECIAFTDTGCGVSFAQRPRQCRALCSGKDGTCKQGFSKQAAAIAWIPFQQLIADAATIAANATQPLPGG